MNEPQDQQPTVTDFDVAMAAAGAHPAQPPATNDHVAPGCELFTEAVELPPTIEQAKAMFKERPDLASVVTTEGLLHRTGELT